MTNSETTMI